MDVAAPGAISWRTPPPPRAAGVSGRGAPPPPPRAPPPAAGARADEEKIPKGSFAREGQSRLSDMSADLHRRNGSVRSRSE